MTVSAAGDMVGLGFQWIQCTRGCGRETFVPTRSESRLFKLMRYRKYNDVRADLQGRFVFQTVAVGMRELFPAVAQVESAVDHGQPAVDGDALQRRRIYGSEILAHPRRVLHLLDVVVAVIERMIRRQFFQRRAGQHLGDLAAEGHVEGHPSAAGVGQQQPAGLQIALQRRRFLRAPGETRDAR